MPESPPLLQPNLPFSLQSHLALTSFLFHSFIFRFHIVSSTADIMSEFHMARRKGLFRMLQEMVVNLQSILGPNIDQSTLREIGIDTTLVDLKEETQSGGVYFRPMSEDCWRKLEMEPEPDFKFCWPRERPSMADAYELFDKISWRLYHVGGEVLGGAAKSIGWEASGWVGPERSIDLYG